MAIVLGVTQIVGCSFEVQNIVAVDESGGFDRQPHCVHLTLPWA